MNVIRERREVVVRRWNPATKSMEAVRSCVVEIEVDMDGLFSSVGESAARNKTGRSREAGGRVEARVVQ